MPEASAYMITSLLAKLTGRRFSLSQTTFNNPGAVKQVYGVYTLDPTQLMRLVQTDVPVLCCLGGALLGLPHDSIQQQSKSATFEPGMADAMAEVLNIISTVVSLDQRAIFRNMYCDRQSLPDLARTILAEPMLRICFTIALDDKPVGNFSIIE